MRVTQSMMANSLLRNLNSSLERQARLQDMMNTQKKINKPSDDPIGTIQSLSYRSRLMEIEQYKKNADEATTWYTATDDAITEVGKVLHTLREKISQAANGPLTPDDRNKIVEEVKQLREQLGDIANTKLDDRYIFAGTAAASDDPPYRDDGSGKSKKYMNTNDKLFEIELSPAVTMPINTSGIKLFGESSPGAKDDVFSFMDNLIKDLSTESGEGISKHLKTLEDKQAVFLQAQAQVGARTNRVQLVQERLTSQNQSAEDNLSKVEDVVVERLIIDILTAENVHRGALSVGGRIIQPSLVDFIR